MESEQVIRERYRSYLASKTTTSCARCELTLVRASDNGEWIDLDGYAICPALGDVNGQEHVARADANEADNG